MRYFVKTPWWLKKIYPTYMWQVDTDKKALFLTFDDGPHPIATPFVLEELNKYNAKATFFCVGQNVQRYRSVYESVVANGHSTGNHTHRHLNGWKVPDQEYLDDAREAAACIDSRLFRPPYGRIRRGQARGIVSAINRKNAVIVMWDVLSADFDNSISREVCLQNVISNAVPGSIVVFHDSEKAFSHLQYALPLTLNFFAEQGYSFEALPHQ